MELTGKCKQDFDKWLKEHRYFIISVETDFYAIWFNVSDSMKYGVLVDFFDEKEIVIDIINDGTNLFRYTIEAQFIKRIRVSRQEVRKQAIIKANEIYNKRLGRVLS